MTIRNILIVTFPDSKQRRYISTRRGGGGGAIFKLGDMTVSRGGRIHSESVSFPKERLMREDSLGLRSSHEVRGV